MNKLIIPLLLFLLAACTPSVQSSGEEAVYLPTIANNDDIWQPTPGTSWQYQLSDTVDTSIDATVYVVDMVETPQSTIDELHENGRFVICYFSAGSWEEYRDDADDFPPAVLGNVMDGWPDEKWLDIRQIDLLAPIMKARLDMAADKQCDGVDPDNVDGYTNDSGFPLTYADQLAYNRWMVTEAHGRGLAIGLKNGLEQISALVDEYEWQLNEQCFQYDECEMLLPFIDAGKPVWNVEYVEEGAETAVFCPQANAYNFDSLLKEYDLGSWRESCR